MAFSYIHRAENKKITIKPFTTRSHSSFLFFSFYAKRFSLAIMPNRKLLGIRIMCKQHRQVIAKVKMITTMANFIRAEETSLSHNDTTYRNRTYSLWVANFWHAFSAFITFNKLYNDFWRGLSRKMGVRFHGKWFWHWKLNFRRIHSSNSLILTNSIFEMG